MPQESALSNEDREKLGKEIGHVDILIGIPSYNNERTIGEIVKSAGAGLSEYFPDESALLVLSDGGSHDDTRRVVKQAAGLLPAIVLSHFVSEGSPRLFWRPKRPRTAPSKTRWSDWAESSNLKNRIWSNSGTRWIRSPIIGCL